MTDSKMIKRILVVDDQAAARRVISGIMSGHGHVDAAENGQDAVTRYAGALEDGWPYDLICLDITMPGLLNGNQVVHCIRAHEEKMDIRQQVPVVMISSHSDTSAVAVELGAHGASDYITKPFDHARLNEVIQRYLY